jgi:Flp pilus assembly protein TadD
MTEPSLAEAEQSLGFLLLKRDDLDEAEKHFDRAAQLDPNDALNFYGQGLVAMAQAGKAGIPAGAAVPFEKSVSLNPEFAPAWNYLAMIYSQRDETLQKALADARRAASLAPGESSYQSQLAAIQDLVSHPGEVRQSAARVQESASDRATAGKTGGLAVRTPPPPPPTSAAPETASTAPTKSPSDSGLRIERKTEPETKPSSTTTVAAAPKINPPPAPVPPLFSATKVYSMVGTITDVNCAIAPQVQITMKSLTIVMKLHAAELAKVLFKSSGADASAKSPVCSSLRGRSARISYVLVLDQPWDGEMQEVEFRSQP